MTDNPFAMPSPKLSPSWGHVPDWYMPFRDREVIVEQRCHADLKLARLAHDPSHEDSAVDVCGYAALLREVTS